MLLLAEYLSLCPSSHNGVEFVINDVNGAQAGVTAAGQVEWTGVDPGIFNITETLPAGYGDPIVFCGYTESPGGGVQHPSLQASAGGIVEGTFPNEMFEFVCYWMNIKSTGQVGTGPDDVANPQGDGLADLLVTKRTCPNDIPPGQDLDYYQEQCTESVDGVEFTLSNDNGSSTKPVDSGSVKWIGLPLGPFTIQEDIPVQFGEPIVFCGWTAIYNNLVYDDFPHLVPSPGGVIEGDITVPNTHSFCYVFNVLGAPGDLVSPDMVQGNLVVRVWDCPEGISQNQDRDYYNQHCQLTAEPVAFTLTIDAANLDASTQGGWVEWNDLPITGFTLAETIPEGFGEPIVFCGWYAYWGGMAYDAFPSLVPSPGGVVEGVMYIPATEYFCDWFNIEGDIDDITAGWRRQP